jgi:UDP-glucose 4-epimerase
MANILVTGGAGYIGSHVVSQLLDSEHNVVIIDNLTTGRKESVLGGKLYIEDIGNSEAVAKILNEEKIDLVMNFASSILVPESVKEPLKYYENNTEKTFRFFKTCLDNNVKKLIFSSTAAVYGEPEGGLCTEDSTIAPINPYGRTKVYSEWLLKDLDTRYEDFNYVALRYFNVAGAHLENKIGQCGPVASHLIKIAAQVVAGKRDGMAIYGDDYPTEDGTCVRDYIHVVDLASAHIKAMEYLLSGGKSNIMNCGYSRGFSVKEVIETVKEVSGLNFPVEVSERRPGDPPVLVAEVNKIKSVLGWTPKYDDLKLICKTAIDWEVKLQKELNS